MKKVMLIGSLLILLVVGILFVPNAVSGLVQDWTFREKVAQSDAVIVGKVLRLDALADLNDPTYREMQVTIKVEYAFKGNVGNIVHIRQPMIDENTWIEDLPTWTIGERVLLFLDKVGVNYTLVGGESGKYVMTQ